MYKSVDLISFVGQENGTVVFVAQVDGKDYVVNSSECGNIAGLDSLVCTRILEDDEGLDIQYIGGIPSASGYDSNPLMFAGRLSYLDNSPEYDGEALRDHIVCILNNVNDIDLDDYWLDVCRKLAVEMAV